MSLDNRIKKIEKSMLEKHGKEKTFIVVKEYEAKYFVEENGQHLEVDKPVDDDPNKTLVILKIYSDPREHHGM